MDGGGLARRGPWCHAAVAVVSTFLQPRGQGCHGAHRPLDSRWCVSRPDAGGAREKAMQVGEFLTVAEREPEDAWPLLRSVLMQASVVACRRAGIDFEEVEDLAHEGLERTSEDGWAALRRADQGAPLRAWAAGVARNLVRELVRRRLRERPVSAEVAGRSRACRLHVSGWADVDLGCCTEKQVQALALRRAGKSEREGARRLGISRQAFRERVNRAIRSLSRIHGVLPPLPTITRAWAEELLRAQGRRLRADHRRCLELYAAGAQVQDIAASLERTKKAVRSLLTRLRRRLERPPRPTP